MSGAEIIIKTCETIYTVPFLDELANLSLNSAVNERYT
jgi:hypothetical protein